MILLKMINRVGCSGHVEIYIGFQSEANTPTIRALKLSVIHALNDL